MRNSEGVNFSPTISHGQTTRKNKKLNLENSPDSEKFDKYVEELSKYIRENSTNENDLVKIFVFFNDVSKKSKYQNKILETPIIVGKMREVLLKPSSNPEVSVETSKIILNISKSHNSQSKLIFETCLNFNSLFEILLVNLNTNLTHNLLTTFSHLTESKEILDGLSKIKRGNIPYIRNASNITGDTEGPDTQTSQLISRLDLSTIVRTLAEKVLDDLISTNKKVLLKILENLYNYNPNFVTKEAIEPLVRCLGNKSNEVVVYTLKILLFFTRDKSFHNDLLNTNFLFRLVRTYKQGIDEMDVVIVKILLHLFDNKNLYEVLFENNVLLILDNYLKNFEVEKNEKYEEVIRNVFEIFKLINKYSEDESNKGTHSNMQNPLTDDENLQLLIFKKSYSLAAFSKSETSILSCLSLLQIMLFKFSTTLLSTNESVKSIIELVPPFFKNKNIDIIKYSLSIFEIILSKKTTYFQETYVKSSNQTFSIKSLVHSVINLVNEFSGNYELLSMSCRILVTLSDIPKLQPHFLQEPQITVLKVFNDNLLKLQRSLKKEKASLEEKLYLVRNNEISASDAEHKKDFENNIKTINLKEEITPICEKESEKDNGAETKNNLGQNNNEKKSPSPAIKLFSKTKLKLASNLNETQKALNISKANNINNNNSSNHIHNANSVGTSKNEEKDRNYLAQIDQKILENIYLIKDSYTVISNLSKNVENLEVLTLKGFLDIITEKLNDNDTETLPYVTRCIQGFCQGQNSIDIILKVQIINKILNIYKLYRLEDEKNQISKQDSNKELNYQNKKDDNNKKLSAWATTAKRLEVLKSLKNILECDIKLQRTFIIEKGIEILLNDVVNESLNISEIVSDQLNEMILKVIYVVSCNINKLFLIYFYSDSKGFNTKDHEMLNSSSEGISGDDEEEDIKEENKGEIASTTKKKNNGNLKLVNENLRKDNNDSISRSMVSKSEDDKLKQSTKKNQNNFSEEEEPIANKKDKLLKIFKEQLSEKKFMNKLTEVGEYDINSLTTYKELIKIFINLYLNRYYLKYFTLPRVFDKVISIINNIMKKYKENSSNENNYEIIKLVIIFLKFICEDETLIKKFLKEDVISILIVAIIENEFYDNIKEEEIQQFYYNFSLVLLRLTEFKGHIKKFETFPDFFNTLEKLYEINSMNGKIYIISIIRNIISEKLDFFDEEELSRFLNKIVSQKNSFIIYEFVELIKNLVHNRSMCKRMENVFGFLIDEIKSPLYSSDFKKKMLDLILCLSYENDNIKDYSLQDLLTLVKNLDININQKTTLLILMNFSSLSSNFSFLMQDYKEKSFTYGDENKINLTKKDFVQVVNQLIDSDKFSQILIQRLLINITSIEGIDMRIISPKIMKVLLDILIKSETLQDNIIIFSLATLVNISNRDSLKFEEFTEENNKYMDKSKINITRNTQDICNKESYEDNNINNTEIIEDNIENKKKSISLYDKLKKLPSKNIKKEKPKIGDLPIGGNKTIPESLNDDSFYGEKDNKNAKDKKNNKNEKDEEKEKEVSIVDYILEKIPNLTDIIKGLFIRGSLDISSLTIMFCCNILRKIKMSKYINLESEIVDCIEYYLKKEKVLNNSENESNECTLLQTDSGKFLLISLIKCFICLSVEENNRELSRNVQISLLPKIIMNNLKDNSSGLDKLKQFPLDLNDIKENTINFACVENQLALFNLILLLSKKKDAKYFFNYQSPLEIRQFIEIFFVEFIKNFSNIILQMQKIMIKQETIKKKGLIDSSNLKEEANNNNSLSGLNLKDGNNSVKEIKNIITENEKSRNKTKKMIGNKDEYSTNDYIILKNQTIQNILISCLKILIEYLIDVDIYFEKRKDKSKDKDKNKNKDKENSYSIKNQMNVQFYNKISVFFENILACILNEPPQYLSEELKSLFIYILFLVFSNLLEAKEKELKEDEEEEDNINKITDKNNDVEIRTKIKTNLENNDNLQKWLMQIFISNKKSIQNDFFCLKIFTITIHNGNFPEIFYQSSKFIKKLMSYLKYSGADKKKRILKTECERILNIISFNPNSHSILYSMGVYSIFKSHLFAKVANYKNENNSKASSAKSPPNSLCQKEDFILLVNMILNKKNKDFIKDDLKRILQNILPSKELANYLRIELFDIYMSSALDTPNENQFLEDYVIIFNLLYNNLKDSFSEMIFLFDKITKTYQNFVKKFLLEDKMMIKIFYDFLKFDKDFPSKSEELNCYLKLLELYLEVGELSNDFKKMIEDFMTQVTKEKTRKNLTDINILHSILNFSFLFFSKFCEKKKLYEDNENNNSNNNENTCKEKDNDPKLDDDEEEENNESSSNDSPKKKKKKKKSSDSINKNIKTKEKIKDFIIKYKYNKLIDIIIYNALNLEETQGVFILSMLIIQDDYKLMLPSLKELGSYLFKKNFFLGFLTKFLDLKKLEVKEFVFVLHLFIVISNISSDGIEGFEEVVYEIVEIYKKYLIKNLTNIRSLLYGGSITSPNNNYNGNNDQNADNDNNISSSNVTGRENNEDNGASRNNGGRNGIDNGGGNQNQGNLGGQTGENENINNNASNVFNETVTSIYFFCDLVKTNELSISGISKVLDFLIFILSDIKNLSFEQKEILIRYYQEILLHFRINTDDELNNHFNFLNKIHQDTALNFIENLTFGTILINTRKDTLLNNINEFLGMVSTICLNNDTNLNDLDKKTLINMYKFCKQICIILNFNTNQNSNINNNNGFNKLDSETKIKVAFHTLESYVNKTTANSLDKIKNDPDLNKKYNKLKMMIQTCLSL